MRVCGRGGPLLPRRFWVDGPTARAVRHETGGRGEAPACMDTTRRALHNRETRRWGTCLYGHHESRSSQPRDPEVGHLPVWTPLPQRVRDVGESARKADRPALMEVIDYIKTHKVAYCIVHKVDRLARNRADDVAIHMALREASVTLVINHREHRRDPFRHAAARH